MTAILPFILELIVRLVPAAAAAFRQATGGAGPNPATAAILAQIVADIPAAAELYANISTALSAKDQAALLVEVVANASAIDAANAKLQADARA